MRNLARALALISLAACGSGKKTADASMDAPPACTGPTAGSKITARQIGTVPGAAMLATSPPADPRLFVVDRDGSIWIFDNEVRVQEAFLDISDDIVAGGEQGLLGLAFHPMYAANGLFFVFYTTSGQNVVARCGTSTSNPNKSSGCTTILSIPDFAGNHNGGMIEFGKDGLLYIGTGDGGGGGDPERTAQDTSNLLGKILRIDVDNKAAGKEYAVPTDNPFGNEVYIYGLRNPWRWSFDAENGDMWIGDVGQGVIEEVDVLKAGEQKGKNLGWSVYEGTGCCMSQGDRCTQSGPQAACNLTDVVMPKDERTHGAGWLAIIGGQVYRGACYTDMVGWYFYSDNNKGGLAKARLVGDTFEKMDLTGQFPNNPASIHGDSRGELFITTSSSPGRIYHIEAGP
jgi:glucose/arabinose dehydrogenase